MPQLPQNSLALVLVDQHGYDITEMSELENGTNSQRKAVGDASKENGTISQGEAVGHASKDSVKKKHLILKKHEDAIKYLKTRENSLNDTILDVQGTLGKYHSSNGPVTERGDLSKIENG